MKIALDGFGGDLAPLAPLEGAAQAVKEYGVEVLITGDEEVLNKTAKEHQIPLDGITFVHTTDVIDICDDPTSLLKEHSESSMAVAMQLVRDGKADAFVSAGSTGAIVVGATLLMKRIKGIKRPTIATCIPCKGGCYLLVDAGANVECRPDMLAQFALMGSIYMNRVMGVSNPRVGLVNIGTEDSKGRELQKETNELLKTKSLHYVGNVEPREVPLGVCDVAVTDGFTGNVMLKLTEGLAKFLMGGLKGIFLQNLKSKVAALLLKDSLKGFKQQLDYTEYGGAPLIGSAKPVIKAHGSSNATAFKNAIRQAKTYVEQDVIGTIARAVEEEKEKEKANA